MNPWYGQIFNPQFIQPSNDQWKAMQHDMEQRQEISKAVKALCDFFDAAQKIEPQYREMALQAFFTATIAEMQKHSR